MTYNEKKSLYDSIMTDVSKIVRKKLNENALHPEEDCFQNMISDMFDIDRRFKDSNFNDVFAYKFPNAFKLNPQTGEIGFTLRVNPANMEKCISVDIYAQNMDDLMKKAFVFNSYFGRIPKVIDYLCSFWFNYSLSDEEQSHISKVRRAFVSRGYNKTRSQLVSIMKEFEV